MPLYTLDKTQNMVPSCQSPILSCSAQNEITELISKYMDGPRELSNKFLSMLIISTPDATGEDATGLVDFDLLMCAPHFIGDGTSLHQSTHDLLCIITSPKSDSELLEELSEAKDWVSLHMVDYSRN